jgi:RNA recognition motif-containing protein
VIRGSEEERKQTATLYVGNIPYSYKESDIRELFSKAGEVVKISMSKDDKLNTHKGYAFIDFKTHEEAERAMDTFNMHVIDKRRLKIDWDIGRDSKNLYKSNWRRTDSSK